MWTGARYRGVLHIATINNDAVFTCHFTLSAANPPEHEIIRFCGCHNTTKKRLWWFYCRVVAEGTSNQLNAIQNRLKLLKRPRLTQPLRNNDAPIGNSCLNIYPIVTDIFKHCLTRVSGLYL